MPESDCEKHERSPSQRCSEQTVESRYKPDPGNLPEKPTFRPADELLKGHDRSQAYGRPHEPHEGDARGLSDPEHNEGGTQPKAIDAMTTHPDGHPGGFEGKLADAVHSESFHQFAEQAIDTAIDETTIHVAGRLLEIPEHANPYLAAAAVAGRALEATPLGEAKATDAYLDGVREEMILHPGYGDFDDRRDVIDRDIRRHKGAELSDKMDRAAKEASAPEDDYAGPGQSLLGHMKHFRENK